MKNKYLIYVTKFDVLARDHRRAVIYEYTGDPFHAMGEIKYRTFDQIYYMTFAEDIPERREYWKNKGVKIVPWVDNYASLGEGTEE